MNEEENQKAFIDFEQPATLNGSSNISLSLSNPNYQ